MYVSAEHRWQFFFIPVRKPETVSVHNILIIMLLQLLVAVACHAHFATARQVSVSFYRAQI